MTDESAKLLAEALNRSAAAIERLGGMGTLGGGIHIYHHGDQPSVVPSVPGIAQEQSAGPLSQRHPCNSGPRYPAALRGGLLFQRINVAAVKRIDGHGSVH